MRLVGGTVHLLGKRWMHFLVAQSNQSTLNFTFCISFNNCVIYISLILKDSLSMRYTRASFAQYAWRLTISDDGDDDDDDHYDEAVWRVGQRVADDPSRNQ